MLLLIHNPRFRLFWVSTVANNLGTMMALMAIGWLTLTISDSPFWVGAVAGMTGLGLFLFSTVGGVLADRFKRKNLIIGSLLFETVTSASIALLIFINSISLWHILCFALVNGAIEGVKIPARSTLLLDLVGRQKLLTAIAMNIASITATGMVAPLIAGNIIENYHIGWAYSFISLTHIVSFILIVTLPSHTKAKRIRISFLQDLTKGFKYVLETPVVKMLLLLVAVTELFGWAAEFMLPVIARNVLNLDARGLGYLVASGNAGAAIATLALANFAEIRRKSLLVIGGMMCFGVFLIAFAASPWFLLSAALLALAFASAVTYETALGTLLQTVVPDDMRGRVVSFQTLGWSMSGMAGFHVGAISSWLGAPVAVAMGGMVILLNAIRVLKRVASLEERTE